MSHVFETLAIGDIIDYDDAIGVSIVAVSDSPESLLASRIPLDEGRSTSISLALSPSKFTYLVF